MITGIGTDLIEIERVKKACEKERFLVKYFTEKEIECFRGKERQLAGNFAVKEAVSKCFGTGFLGFSPGDIEVLREKNGRPYVNLYGGALETAEKLGIKSVHISITNVKEYAQAFAVAESI